MATRTELNRYFNFFVNEGTVDTGKWMFAPHGFDGAFEVYSLGYDSREAAEQGACEAIALCTAEELEEFEQAAVEAGR